MTGDASGVIIDTSKGRKNTEFVLKEQTMKDVVTTHNTAAVDRAKIAIMMR